MKKSWIQLSSEDMLGMCLVELSLEAIVLIFI